MPASERFATAICCIDGRFQVGVIDQLQLRFGVRHVDKITTAGAVKHVAGSVTPRGEALFDDVSVSIAAHDSQQIAIVAHGDCAGNPVPDHVQKEQLVAAAEVIGDRFPDAEVIALFLDPRTGFDLVV